MYVRWGRSARTIHPEQKRTSFVTAQHPLSSTVNRPPRPLTTGEIRHWHCGGRTYATVLCRIAIPPPGAAFSFHCCPFLVTLTCLCIPQPTDFSLDVQRVDRASLFQCCSEGGFPLKALRKCGGYFHPERWLCST